MKTIFSWLLMSIIGLNGIGYLILASLLATEFGHRNIPSYLYGIMLSAYAFAAMIGGFTAFWFVEKLTRSKVIFIGIIAMSASICGMGLLTYIK